MGRAPCCDKANVKKGPWSPEEDAKLKEFIEKFGTGGNWIALPQKAGLKRCGKSCRLRWLNYLRPNIRHGEFSDEEDRIICSLYANIGSRWSIIAAQLPGRTDNDIKNYWNTKLKKKLMGMMPPFLDHHQHHRKIPPPFSSTPYSSSSTKALIASFDQSFISSPTPNLFFNNNNLYLQSGQEGLMNNLNHSQPMQFYTGKDNMLMFGGVHGHDHQHQASLSCSSSDGSCSQISYNGKEKQEDNNTLQLQGFFPNNTYDLQESSQKFVLESYGNNNGNNHHQQQFMSSGVFGSSGQLEYDLEEVKQLISSNPNSGLQFFNDENKTHESGGRASMYYYY